MTKARLSAGLILTVCLIGVVQATAQHGGKAEPNRITFPNGKPSTTLTSRLSDGQEMEYVFSARKGQKVTLRNANTSRFDLRIFSKEFGVETEFESSRVFTLPATGDYLLFVRKKAGGPRTATFNVTLTIK